MITYNKFTAGFKIWEYALRFYTFFVIFCLPPVLLGFIAMETAKIDAVLDFVLFIENMF